MRRSRVILAGLFALLVVEADGAEFFVAPDAGPGGVGSTRRPWSLTYALSHPPNVKPGDTIWLRGGTYRGKFVTWLTGTPSAPIVVRSYPGEWAKIDSYGSGNVSGDILQVNGAHTWYWGFEIMSSDPLRQSLQNGSGPSDITRGGCASTNAGYGVGVKFINLVCHDAAGGISPWRDSSDAEVYGNIIYNNGWNGATDRGHGHGIYAQNANGSKFITDNIILQNYDINVQIYTSSTMPLNNFVVDGNIIYQAGKTSTSGAAIEVVFGGGAVATNARFTNNTVYSKDGNYCDFGYQWGQGMRPATVTGNIIAASGSSVSAMFTNTLDVLTMTGNLFWGTVMNWSSGGRQINYSVWTGNTFIPYKSRPTGTNIVVRPNKYEGGRGYIAVFNWDLQSTVDVDVSSILTVGASYEVRSAQDFFAPPVLSGRYDGTPLAVPMTGLSVATPIGGAIAPPATGPEFDAFVVLSKPDTSGKREAPIQPINGPPPIRRTPGPH